MKPEEQIDTSKLAYSITISLELYPGTRATKEQLASLKCNSRWESVRQAWAEFTGKPYIIIPKYQTNQTNQTNKGYDQGQRYSPYNNQYTRGYRGGKKKQMKKTRNKYSQQV
jgi:hypothetical protein